MMRQCSRCGIESEIEQAFHKQRRWWIGPVRYYCPTCSQKQQVQAYQRGLWLLPLALLLALGLLWLDPHSDLAWLMLRLFALWGLIVPLVFVHELAHALAARLLGLRVFAVQVGVGRTLFQGRRWGVRWELKAVPLAGLTLTNAPPGPLYRLRVFLVTLAGPASHALLLVLFALLDLGLLLLPILALAQSGLEAGAADLAVKPVDLVFAPGSPARLFYSLADFLLQGLVFANLALLAASLFPAKVSTPLGMSGSDGLHLLKLPFARPAEMQERQAAYYVMEALDALQRHAYPAACRWVEQGLARFPNDRQILNALGVIQLRQQAFAQARQIFVELAQRPSTAPGEMQPHQPASPSTPAPLNTPPALKPELRAMFLNNVAYADLMLAAGPAAADPAAADPALLPEADACSAEAYKIFPWHPALIGTRGAVLVELGQLDAGIALLQTALARSEEANGKASDACHLAIAEARRGDLPAARRYLDLARKLDPGCYLLPRVETELQKLGIPW